MNDYNVKGIARVQVQVNGVWVLTEVEVSSGNGSKGGWVLLLDRRDQKYTYFFVMLKESY